MCLGSLRSLGSLRCLGSLGSRRSLGSLGVSGFSGVLESQEPTVCEGEGLLMLPLRALLAGVEGEGLERRGTGSQSIVNAQGIWEQPPSDVTGSASDCLGITPLGGFRLNRWDPKFPNLKHHVLGLLGGGPLQRRSFSGAICSYQAVRPGERCVPGATETYLRCQQDQILGLGLRQGERRPDCSQTVSRSSLGDSPQVQDRCAPSLRGPNPPKRF